MCEQLLNRLTTPSDSQMRLSGGQDQVRVQVLIDSLSDSRRTRRCCSARQTSLPEWMETDSWLPQTGRYIFITSRDSSRHKSIFFLWFSVFFFKLTKFSQHNHLYSRKTDRQTDRLKEHLGTKSVSVMTHRVEASTKWVCVAIRHEMKCSQCCTIEDKYCRKLCCWHFFDFWFASNVKPGGSRHLDSTKGCKKF